MAISPTNTIIRAVVPKTVVATVDRMAKVAGKSRSAVVSEFLVEVEPALRRLASMLEVAKAQQSLFPKSAVSELEAALDQLSGNAVDVMARLDKTLQLPLEKVHAINSAAPAGARRARPAGRRSGRKNPRPVTRG